MPTAQASDKTHDRVFGRNVENLSSDENTNSRTPKMVRRFQGEPISYRILGKKMAAQVQRVFILIWAGCGHAPGWKIRGTGFTISFFASIYFVCEVAFENTPGNRLAVHVICSGVQGLPDPRYLVLVNHGNIFYFGF
jgi:hypothetical protein